MTGFPEGHERLVAIEWLVARLAAEHCLRSSEPLSEAARIVEDAKEYGMTMIAAASGDGNINHVLTAVQISAALSQLVESLPEDVAASL